MKHFDRCQENYDALEAPEYWEEEESDEENEDYWEYRIANYETGRL
jgi:hypothetical protein